MIKDDKKSRIVNIIKESEPLTSDGNNINIDGSNNIVAGNNINISPTIKRVTLVKSGDGTLSGAQKGLITQLINEWTEKASAVKKSDFPRARAWSALRSHFKVNSYHEIQSDKFEEAREFIRWQIAIIMGARSAPNKIPSWRKDRYGAIKARCKNKFNDPRCYSLYLKKKFDAESLTDLTDDQLQMVYEYIMNRRK